MNRIKTTVLLVVLLGALAPARAGDYGTTARGIFALLPPSIFENTPAGLDEAGKQALLHYGASEDWEIAGETQDVLVFAELPFRDRSVALRLFRNEVDGSTEVAVGTLGDPVCTVELWRLDASGRIVPVDTPPEPPIGEFFTKRRIPRNQQNSVLICLGPGGLRATPVFWNRNGPVDPRADNEISYQWDGSKFEKVVQAVKKGKVVPGMRN